MPGGGSAAARSARSRWTERHVLALGLGVAGLLLAGAAVAAVSAVLRGGSPWAAIHLALAGAASVAIGAFMPHFAITLAGTQPRGSLERTATLLLLALGAAAVVAGVTLVGGWLAGIGSVAMLAGLVLVAIQTLAPLRNPLARRHPVVTLTYGAALVELAAGITLGGLGAVGYGPVLAAWAGMRAAHAWIGLFGAVSLTIFATLVYLAPTVLGARIRPTPWLVLGVTGMLVGPPLAAAGFALSAWAAVMGGMVVTLAGAVGQIGYVMDAAARRGRFTSEHDWRRVAVGHLLAGPAWFAAAVAAALAGIIDTDPAGWSIGVLAIPMIGGWLAQELIGSWTHLAPSVTPGTPGIHARQRRVLAAFSRTRLVAHNAGVGLAWAGIALGQAWLAAIGLALLGASVVTAVVTLGRALALARA
ncbi:MAG TPA: hypothetical protein VHR55_00405 [Candidatus Limnocylindria bacterium]|nr:hypothetical protein [Candidatus Limnocylindria bacterium]